MAETTAEVRRDIEQARARMTDTLQELEQKLNVVQMVKNNPWPALAVAVGAGILLSGSRADMRAAAATVHATKGAGTRISSVFDNLVSSVIFGMQSAIEHRIDKVATDVKRAVVAPLVGVDRPMGASDTSTTVPRAD